MLFATVFLLATGVVERGELRLCKPPQSLRIACLSHRPPPPLVALTSPAPLPLPLDNPI